MAEFAIFPQVFGSPRPGTAADLEDLGLSHSAQLRDFAAEVGGGVFARGFISVLSVREQVPSLGGWERHLPPGARPFATTAFGFLLLTTTGDDVWIVDTQVDNVFEADQTIREAILTSCENGTREEVLHESLFHRWSRNVLELDATKVLSLSPAWALGGTWSRECLRETDLRIHLSFTAQLSG
jgi:hypothetical protein